MSSFWYSKTKEKLLKGTLGDLSALTLTIMAVDAADYTVDADNDEFLDDIPSAARIASVNLSSVTVSGGMIDAADPTFSAVTGDQFEALVIYVNTGTEGTSALLGYTNSATGLPYTPSGGDITLAFPATGVLTL